MTRVKWWGTGLVALTLLVLWAGLPLLDKALGNGGRPLAPGTVVSVGTERDGVRPITLTIPHGGWALDEAETSLTGNAELTSEDVVVNLNVAVPLAPFDARELWDGLGRIVALGGRTRLGARPVPIVTAHGMTGLTGTITGRDRAGTAAVFATDTLGATVTAAGPPLAFRSLAPQVQAMVRTLTIAAPWTSETGP
ncbi:hypothetical protein ETD83_08200 [Actinomadura soli]|uniref:Uncharacterized protein n=1 Tax=Actinomadura soli TaxID=2508997 RepID=A0A5C4JGI9_9ACTN|nr:hypothetical protein [Actinomadura soli]TMR04753.1 hypothetical protein ETD83_08200 [Actinomadura soli]